MSRVVATVGAIPGAGATTVVSALGSALAEQRSHVALVDASAEGSRIADVLSLEGDGVVADALRRRADLADVQASGPHGLHAFPAAPDTNWAAIRPGAVESAYEQLRERFEIVLVDCGSELTPASAAWIGHADELVVVSCPDVADAAADAAALGAAFDVPIRGIVANRVVPDERASTLDALDASPHQTLGVLPEDATVDAAASEQRSVLVHEPDSQIASCAWEFARRVRESDHAEPVVPDAWSRLDATAGGTASGTKADGGAASASAADAAPSADTDSTAASDASPDGSDAESSADAASSDRTASDPIESDRSASRRQSDGASTTPDPSETETSSEAVGADDASDSGSDGGSDSGFEWSDSEDLDGDGFGTDGSDSDSRDADGSDLDGPDADAVGTAGDGLDDEPAASSSSLSSGISTDLQSDDSGSAASDAGSTSTDSGSRSTDAAADSSSVRSNGGSSARDDDHSESTASTDGDGDADDEAEISDEEIEAVFKETMQQVKEDRDAEEEEETETDAGEDGDDSVLGGFMGS